MRFFVGCSSFVDSEETICGGSWFIRLYACRRICFYVKNRKQGRGRYIVLVPAVLLMVFTIYLMLTPPQTTDSVNVTNRATAPDFTLETIDGKGLTGGTLSFSSLRGKPILIDFVFEWCPHCNNMAPIMERLHKEYGDRVTFVTVMGSQNTNPEKSAEFLARHGVKWAAVYDKTMKTFIDYGVRGTPTYVFIRPDGTILRKLPGEPPYETLKLSVEELLTGL